MEYNGNVNGHDEINVKNVARKSILSSKVLNESLMNVDQIVLDDKKTKSFVQIIKNLGLESKKVTFLVNENDQNAYKSSRNLHNVNMCLSSNVSNYDLINNDTIVIDQKSLEYFNKI